VRRTSASACNSSAHLEMSRWHLSDQAPGQHNAEAVHAHCRPCRGTQEPAACTAATLNDEYMNGRLVAPTAHVIAHHLSSCLGGQAPQPWHPRAQWRVARSASPTHVLDPLLRHALQVHAPLLPLPVRLLLSRVKVMVCDAPTTPVTHVLALKQSAGKACTIWCTHRESAEGVERGPRGPTDGMQ
jgi:hypothetical protein